MSPDVDHISTETRYRPPVSPLVCRCGRDVIEDDYSMKYYSLVYERGILPFVSFLQKRVVRISRT